MPLIMRLLLILALLLVSGSGVFAQAANVTAPVSIQSVYVAKDDGTGKAGSAGKNFLPTDIPLYCVVQLDSSTPVTVKMNLVAAKVPGVKIDTKVVSVSYMTKDGQDRVNFMGRPAGKWVVGTYRVDIFLDDKLVKNLSFEIRDTPKNAESATLLQPGATSGSRSSQKKN